MNKVIALLILVSFTTAQITTAPVFAQKYKIIPPGAETTSTAALKGGISVIPSGTTFAVEINSAISSIDDQIGELFTATLSEPVFVNGQAVIPQGSDAIGQITYLEKAGRIGKNAKMEVKFTHIKFPNGQKIPVSGKLETIDGTGLLKGGAVKKQLVKPIFITTAGATAAGLSIGSIAGSAGAGTLFGVTTGGVASLVYILCRKGQPVKIPCGTKVLVTLENPVSIGK